MGWGRSGVAALAVVALAAACDDGGGGMEPDPGTDITVTVTADGEGVPAVRVDLFAPGGTTPLETAATDAAGEARFTELDAGTYEVEIAVPDGFVVSGDGPIRQAVQATESQPGAVTFMLEAEDTGAGPAVVEIHLTSSLVFSPAEVTIAPGTTVRWINDASIFHTITPNGHSEWDRATMSTSGATFSHTFDAVGEYPYFCEPHRSQGMTGTVIVQDGAPAGGRAGGL